MLYETYVRVKHLFTARGASLALAWSPTDVIFGVQIAVLVMTFINRIRLW